MELKQAELFETSISPNNLCAGIDEAGRGCLAGPVVAAAVILPASFDLPGLKDSKQLSAKARQHLFPAIKTQALAWGLGASWPCRIDQINILNATFEAMAKAVASLKITPDLLLVDGCQIIPKQILSRFLPKGGFNISQSAIVKGDAKVAAISAASIIAKVFRDRLMAAFDRHYPVYGFATHKGYGTKRHLLALVKYGPCQIHRLSFNRVRPV